MHPAVRLGTSERTARRGQEVLGQREPLAVARQGPQRQDERDAVVQVLHLRREVLAGGGDGQPLDQRALAG